MLGEASNRQTEGDYSMSLYVPQLLKKLLPFVSVDFSGVEVVLIYLGRPISVPNDQALWWILEYPLGRGPLNLCLPSV